MASMSRGNRYGGQRWALQGQSVYRVRVNGAYFEGTHKFAHRFTCDT